MGDRKTLGNIGLGNFCKAVLEHKNIKVFSEKYNNTYMFKWDNFSNAYSCNLDCEYWLNTDIINIFITDVYNLVYTWEII